MKRSLGLMMMRRSRDPQRGSPNDGCPNNNAHQLQTFRRSGAREHGAFPGSQGDCALIPSSIAVKGRHVFVGTVRWPHVFVGTVNAPSTPRAAGEAATVSTKWAP